ncbi:hypothetical protein OG225_41815 (plasmid) [Nocardia sp. NBC_01377]|uniref:hypothetical protein n=1 Tax=Nocardia sp. NBC_01377 TaxID=2903595 RepID=UPI002F90E927
MTAVDHTRFRVGDEVHVVRVYTPPTMRSRAEIRGLLTDTDEHSFVIDGERGRLCWNSGPNIEQTVEHVRPA